MSTTATHSPYSLQKTQKEPCLPMRLLLPVIPERAIFFGTSGGGLTEYNFLTNSFTTDTTIKEVVTAILEDHNHILWVATQNSLVHAIDLLTKRKTTFRLEHKVNKKRFSIYKMAEISDSSIWLATDMGVFTITNQKG